MNGKPIKKTRLNYLIIFLLLFFTELLIAVFVHDKFIRPYVGDMLVVILIYTFLRIFVPNGIKHLVWYIFLFAAAVEILQYFHLGQLLGLSDNRVAMIVIGSTFDIKDILCYFAGCVLLWRIEKMSHNEKRAL